MKNLKVDLIQHGTVIDHITAGMALKVLRILGVGEMPRSPVSVVMNVPSKREERKDVVKIEDRELVPEEVDKIALIAPRATINIIRRTKVVAKHRVELPKAVVGFVRCGNSACITNALREPLETRFTVQPGRPPRLRCAYCERDLEDVGKHIV